MGADLTPIVADAPAISVSEEAELLRGILAYNPEVSQAQQRTLVRMVMQSRGMQAAATSLELSPRTGPVLLRPGVVQALALGVNYGVVLGLDLSGLLQSSDLPPQAVLLGVNYLMLTSLMMSLSVLCIIHSFLKVNLRPAYRALLISMGVTGLFGMMETIAFSASSALLPLFLLLFVVTVPLGSLFVALFSFAQGLNGQNQERGVPLQLPSAEPHRFPNP